MKSMKGKPNTGLKSDGSHFLMIGVYHTTRARRGRTTTTTITTTTEQEEQQPREGQEEIETLSYE
jgi:hypothetical protein